MYEGFRVDRLKKVMEEHGVEVKDIAESLKEVQQGLSVNAAMCQAYRIVKGKYKFYKVDDLYAICKACNCSADYLIGLSDDVN